jgi:hypothetical protein
MHPGAGWQGLVTTLGVDGPALPICWHHTSQTFLLAGIEIEETGRARG